MRFQKPAFTLLELLVAMGIGSIVITSALGVVGTIYFSQKKIQFSHDFYAESRYLMERIAQIVRNNTIDYDRFFIEVGPPTDTCGSFNVAQIPQDAVNNANDKETRAFLTYPTIFYWDTDGDNVQDRNLGGKVGIGAPVDDPCAQAWDKEARQKNLYLINASRTLRTTIRFNDDNNTVEVQRQLGADIDNDGIADIWAPFDANGDGDYEDAGENSDAKLRWNASSNRCEILYDAPDENGNVDGIREIFEVRGDAASEAFCDLGHDFTTISPMAVKVNDLYFYPAPNRDPYLAFRVDEAQVHPSTFIALSTELRNPNKFGFEPDKIPRISFQTMVSSRVFGNIRE